MSSRDLPEWVWKLVIGLKRYEDEHPLLYRMESDCSYVRAECPGKLLNIVPENVHDTAEVLTEFGITAGIEITP